MWDVSLDTSAGASSWQGLPTILAYGTVTVSAGACSQDMDCEDGNSCTDNVCDAGVCRETVVQGACDDGDPCTINDSCLNTTCLGFAVNCSGLDDACNVGVCNATTGVCEATTINESGLCDDADVCTQGDLCTSGTCAGVTTDCTSLDAFCSVGICNQTTGVCEISPVNESVACDDGDLCTQNDACGSGSCLGVAVDCTGLGDVCNTASCNPATGLCELAPANDGTPCNDNNACTLLDICGNGSCSGSPINCSFLDDVCLLGICDPSSGICQALPGDEGGTCDDGDLCTETDVCTSGVCVGAPIPGCSLCTLDSECNDGNICTENLCIGGVCQTSNLNISCSDGNPCTTGDVCFGGLCSGTPVDCSSQDDVCSVGVCNLASGACQPQPSNEGGACNDGLVCTTGDACASGLCAGTFVGTPVVDVALEATAPESQVGQLVQIELVATAATCADMEVTLIDAVFIWDPAVLELVGFSPGAPGWASLGFPNDSALDQLNDPFTGTPSNDGDAYFQAIANLNNPIQMSPAGSVVVRLEFIALSGTSSTQVALLPTGGTFAKTRVIGGGAFLGLDITGSLSDTSLVVVECQSNADCDDGNLCTDEVCGAGICQVSNNSVSCDDGLFCTDNDSCSGGACVGGGDPCPNGLLCSEPLNGCVECLISLDCEDGNPCTDDVCSVSGTCSHNNNSAPCDDGLFCTAVDVCGLGTCNGGGTPCPAGTMCDEQGDRCVQCLLDGDCDDSNICTSDFCALNVCQNTANTLACDDGNFCTTGDICSNGQCAGGPSPCAAPLLCNENTNTCVSCIEHADCEDGNLCTTDTCTLGVCLNADNTLACDDGLFCTSEDRCSSGVCAGPGDACPGMLCDEDGDLCVECFTIADCPDDGVACTIDQCLGGLCTHEADDTFCDDNQFCNGSEICNAIIGCVVPGSPCDIPSLCDEATDSCGCQSPTVVAEGPRYLNITPQAGETPIALVVIGVDPEVSCISLYVQGNGLLGPNPVFKTPSGPSGWVTVHVRGDEISPATSYIVQAECETGAGLERSSPQVVTTWSWADTDNSGGITDIVDMTAVVDGFSGNFVLATFYGVDLWGGEDCAPQLVIDVVDMTRVVQAFEQFPYPCADPCP